MINKPSDYIGHIGKNILYTTMLFTILNLSTSFSDGKYPPNNNINNNNNKENIENTLDLKAIYKADISKSILDAKSFPIYLAYTHEKELKAGGFTLRRTISFDEKMQAFTLTDETGKSKHLCFRVKVPFDYGNDEVKKLYIKSFGFNAKENKFTMQGIYSRDSKNALKEVLGKLIVGAAVERTINLKKIVIVNTILPGVQGEQKYPVKIPINNASSDNPTGDVVEAIIIEYIPKNVKGTRK